MLLVTSQGWGLNDLPLRASNEGWFIWSISSIWFIWLIELESHAEEPGRPERPANQTDEPAFIGREHRGSSGSIPRFLSKTPKALAWATIGEELSGLLLNLGGRPSGEVSSGEGDSPFSLDQFLRSQIVTLNVRPLQA
jgi:hypothetical protein